MQRTMIDLEKHIRDQRDHLDIDQPSKGHEARFLKKLDKPLRRVNFRHVLQIAASIAIILTSAVVLIQQNKSGSKIAEREIPTSVQEADMYFTSQMDQRYDQIREFSFDNAEEKAVLLHELEDLDAFQQQLLEDLEANPGDERVINALIRHYQIKLDVMDQIIVQLNQLKTETKNQNEKESV
jgi:low affinity Fe/Cu permease